MPDQFKHYSASQIEEHRQKGLPVYRATVHWQRDQDARNPCGWPPLPRVQQQAMPWNVSEIEEPTNVGRSRSVQAVRDLARADSFRVTYPQTPNQS